MQSNVNRNFIRWGMIVWCRNKTSFFIILIFVLSLLFFHMLSLFLLACFLLCFFSVLVTSNLFFFLWLYFLLIIYSFSLYRFYLSSPFLFIFFTSSSFLLFSSFAQPHIVNPQSYPGVMTCITLYWMTCYFVFQHSSVPVS